MVTVEWAGVGVILSLIGTIVALFYNRWLSYGNLMKKQEEYNIQVHDLQIMFAQYQKDMAHYLDICELCRTDVRRHHEGQTAEHVSPALKDQIKDLVRDVAEIKRFLMERGSGG
jgi:hypothetical protein